MMSKLMLHEREVVKERFLDYLNMYSDVPWKVTSWIRNSPSHKNGNAVDYAPTHFLGYAVMSKRDPLLFFRSELIDWLEHISKLATATLSLRPLIFVESDHLHVYFMRPELYDSAVRSGRIPKNKIVLWNTPRSDVYNKSLEDFNSIAYIRPAAEIRRLRVE